MHFSNGIYFNLKNSSFEHIQKKFSPIVTITVISSPSPMTSQGQGHSLIRSKTVTVSENSSLDMIKRILWINVIVYPNEPSQCICFIWLKREWILIQGRQLSNYFRLPSEQGSILKGNNLPPWKREAKQFRKLPLLKVYGFSLNNNIMILDPVKGTHFPFFLLIYHM